MILPFFFSCKRWSFGVIRRMYYDLWIPARFTLSYLLALVLHPGGKNYSAATAQFFYGLMLTWALSHVMSGVQFAGPRAMLHGLWTAMT